jgi:hypothetical protein
MALCGVVEELASLAPGKLSVLREPSPTHAGHPSVRVRNVQYLAVPAGQELEPFLDLLVSLSSAPLDEGAAASPATVEVLIASTCPSCSAVVGACAKVAVRNPRLQLVVIDAQYFRELAGACKSVPTVIVDGARTVVGPLSTEELEEILLERDQPDYALKALASIVDTGRFTGALPLLSTDAGLMALAELMGDGAMQQRLGLMLLVEEAVQTNPHALDAALPYLLPLLEVEDPTLRGDTADLLGRIGAPGAREALTRLLSDDNADVRDVAEESLSKLRQPS